ncbi:hypothetical protein BDN72DRAFT_955366 [Pluteus cervinus]|uniref:Uncharacterized protein n=1 Tax=Pluteus cervinus TaxID=181527 RepID=A0ACD3BA98_9AGAR|nr:hypothetical protein BDN72DRAFT_955366 [Pluteus cervinus]
MQALDLASRIQASNLNGNLKPRAHLEGLELNANFQLPDLQSVRDEVVLIPEALNSPLEQFKGMTITNGGDCTTSLDDPSRPVVCNIMLPALFRWSYFVHSSDIPEDLLEPCLFSLKMFLRLLEEAPEKILYALAYYHTGQDTEAVNYALVANCRMKILCALTRLNRPAEAAPFLEKWVEVDTEKLAKEGKQAWMVNPVLFAHYGESLMTTDLREAKLQLEKALAGAEGPHGALIKNLKLTIFRIRVDLVAVLSQLGEDVQKRKSHEEWALKYLRKNPFIIPENLLRLLLLRKGFPEHPVLSALGGPKWFDKRKLTYKNNERRTKMCRNCGQREPPRTLSVCAGCKSTWYCSKECQVENWKAHRGSCKQMVEERKTIELIKLADPSAGQRNEDWVKWRTSHLGIPVDTALHALGLHRDIGRGITHILWYGVKYTPDAAKDVGKQFTIETAGVFKITDVLTEIETCLQLNKGKGQQCINDILRELKTSEKLGERRFPYTFILVCQDGFRPGVFLGNGMVDMDYLRGVKYDHDWRKNIKKPPGPVVFRRSEIVDQEHIF